MIVMIVIFCYFTNKLQDFKFFLLSILNPAHSSPLPSAAPVFPAYLFKSLLA